MKYEFENVVFTPTEESKLRVDGKTVVLQDKQVQVLQFFLDNTGKFFSKEQLLIELWGPGIHRDTKLTNVLTVLKKKLPETSQIHYVKHHGYRINVDVKRTQIKPSEIEDKLVHSNTMRAFVTAQGLFTLFLMINAIMLIYAWLFPAPSFSLEKQKPLFTRDYVVKTPQLSPDGRYIAHELSKGVYEEDYLGLYDLKWGDTKPLVPMRFDDGFKWNLAGDKIVYQKTIDGDCEIRLLHFNANKTIKADNQLIECAKNSGSLSFAWFNQQEFYVNLVPNDSSQNHNGLSQHLLYSININTLQVSKHNPTPHDKGIGFFSLEYDEATQALYLLQTNKFVSTEFYRYKDGKLTQIGAVDYEVKFYSVNNDRLIFKNNDNDFLINQPADDFAGSKALLTTAMSHISQPHVVDDNLVFLTGHIYRRSLKKWSNGKTQDVHLADFEPRVIARYKQQLVFSSNQSGINQLYMTEPNHPPQMISQFNRNQPIQHIEVSGDYFALSYIHKVELYRFRAGQLQLVGTWDESTNGVVSGDGQYLLLSDLSSKADRAPLIEISLITGKPTGLTIADGKFGFYHNQLIYYVNHDKELIRLIDGNQRVIANDVDISGLKSTSIYQDSFYYVTQSSDSRVHLLDLITGEQQQFDTDIVNLRKIEVIDGELYFGAWQTLKPKLVHSSIKEQ